MEIMYLTTILHLIGNGFMCYMTGEQTAVTIWVDVTENANNVQPKNGLRLTISSRQYIAGYLFVIPDLQ